MAKENQLLNSMLRTAQERLAAHDPLEIARRAAVPFDGGAFGLTSLGRGVSVLYPDYRVETALPQWQLLTLLHYLDIADGTPLSSRQMTFARYRDGMVRGGGFDRDAEPIIRDKLGKMEPARLTERCLALGAKILPSNADLCAQFDFAPRYPVWLKLWFADDEFPASGRMLVDESAAHYLTIEDAVTVGALIFDLLCGAGSWI